MARDLRGFVRRLGVDPDEQPASERLATSRTLLLVAVGGALGALGRGALEAAVPARGGWPVTTLVINVVGAGLLGVLLGVVETHVSWAPLARPLLGTGLLGGFTTMSTFCVEVVKLSDASRGGLAAAYVVVTVVGGLVAAFAGTALGRWLADASMGEGAEWTGS